MIGPGDSVILTAVTALDESFLNENFPDGLPVNLLVEYMYGTYAKKCNMGNCIVKLP
jgi:hypothetical protein